MVSAALAFPPSNGQRRRVLLVEDDESIREAFADLLEFEGYDLCATGDGEAALTLIATGSVPDVILLDMMMPLMDGHTFLRRLQEQEGGGRIPVVVVSATQQERPPNVVAFIRKPFEPAFLLDLLAKLFAGKPS